MPLRRNLLPLLLGILPCVAAFSLDEHNVPAASKRGDMWLCFGGEGALYSIEGGAYGGSLALGYGTGAAIGVKAAYLADPEGFATLELNFLLRWYLAGRERYSGPFIQLNGGPAIFIWDNNIAIPAEYGAISAGASLGWRFLLGNRWFVETGIRGGYPYGAGAGVSAGFRN